MDSGSPVSESYQAPFAFPGIIKKVEIKLSPSRLSRNEYEKVRTTQRNAAMAIE